MSDLLLLQTATGIADGNGNCTLSLGPTNARETWTIERISIQNTSTVKFPTCRLYRNTVADSSFLVGTAAGRADTDTETLELNQLERVYAVWQSCDVNSVCTMTVHGKQRLLQRLY